MAYDPLVFIGVGSLAIVTIAYLLKSETKSPRRSSSSYKRTFSDSLGSFGSMNSQDSGRTYKTVSSKRSSKSKSKKFKPKIYSV